MADGQATDASDALEVRLRLPGTAVQAVEQLATLQSVSKTEVVWRSISLMSFVQQLVIKGGDLLVEWPDGSIERVVLPAWWPESASR